MLKKSLAEKQAVVFDLFTNISANFLDIFVVVVTLTVLCLSMYQGATHKMRFNKNFATWLGIIYAIFIILSTIAAVYQAYFI